MKLMHITILLILFPLASFSAGNGFYFFPGPFETQTYNAISREEFMEKALIHGLKKIPENNKKSLAKLLNINDGVELSFDNTTVRALVIIGDNIYFIDTNGVVYRNGHSYTAIDKTSFKRMLSN
jgi:hypothetical protein